MFPQKPEHTQTWKTIKENKSKDSFAIERNWSPISHRCVQHNLQKKNVIVYTTICVSFWILKIHQSTQKYKAV